MIDFQFTPTKCLFGIAYVPNKFLIFQFAYFVLVIQLGELR